MVGAGRGNLGANLAVLLLRRLSQIYKRRVTAENCAPPDADYTPFDKSSADNHSATTAAPRRPTVERLSPLRIAEGIIDKIDAYLFDKPLLLIGEDGAYLINRSTPIAFIARGK